METILATIAPADATHEQEHATKKKIAIKTFFFMKTLADSKISRTFATAIEKQTMQAIK